MRRSGMFRPLERVEDHPRLDVNELRRGGFLSGRPEAFRGRGEWDPSGLVVVPVEGTVELWRAGTPLASIELEATPCNFGGKRTWFRCPVRGCWARCAVLFWRGGRFSCRRCSGLRYQSQLEDTVTRRLQQARAIREQFGGKPYVGAPFPPKPPTMRWRRYSTLRDQVHAVEAAWAAGFSNAGPSLPPASAPGRLRYTGDSGRCHSRSARRSSTIPSISFHATR